MMSFEQLLDFRFLTASMRDMPSIGDLFFTNKFFVGARDIPTDEWELINYGASNSPVTANTVGSSANRVVPIGGTKRIASMFYTYNMVNLPAIGLQALREEESHALQSRGAAVVEAIQEEFVNRHRILKEGIIATILAFHRVNFDASGNLLRPTVDSLTGAQTNAAGTLTSADYTVPNSRRGNLTDTAFTPNAVIDVMWSTSTAKIWRHLEQIGYRAQVAGVPKPTEIYVNALNKPLLADNTEFQAWATRNQRSQDTVLAGEMVENLWGYNWHFIAGTYQDVNGATVDLIPRRKAIILPPMGPWLRPARGLELVPNSIDLQGDWRTTLNGLQEVYGEFAYAHLEHNPARLDMYMGDKWGLALPNPNAVWAPDVFETSASASDVSGTG